MASAFQRRKVTGVFDAMAAEDRDYLTEGDFAALAARWTALRGVTPGSAQDERLRAIMLGWWTSLSSAADNSDRVTLDDVLTVVDLLPTMSDAVLTTADAMFQAIDENDDDRISRDEYRQLIRAWTGRDTDTDTIFPLLDLDHDGYISAGEFRELWTQFWAGDDADAPGNWVFGRFDTLSRTTG
jgi:hypothetical protein